MRTGILTFHCADNYGAMLQAYGLKNFFKNNRTRHGNRTLRPLFYDRETLAYPLVSGDIIDKNGRISCS